MGKILKSDLRTVVEYNGSPIALFFLKLFFEFFDGENIGGGGKCNL